MSTFQPSTYSGAWTDQARQTMQQNPDYFVWWYTVKSLGLVVVAMGAAYYAGKLVEARR